MRPREIELENFGARAAAGSEPSAGSVPWTVGTTPTGAALAGPPYGVLLGAGSLGQGCPGRADRWGTAKDCAGVTRIVLRQEDEGGRSWGVRRPARGSRPLHTARAGWIDT